MKGKSGWSASDKAVEPTLVPRQSTITPQSSREVTGLKIKGWQLFIDGVDFADPTQRDVGDCLLVASMRAVAKMNPEASSSAFKKTRHGWEVRIFEKKHGVMTPTWVTVGG